MQTTNLRSLVSILTFTAITSLLHGGSLLSTSIEQKLESWIGLGDLDFNQLFLKERGDGQNASAFHSSADNQGATITLISVYGDHNSQLAPQIIGGYNPLSWNSSINGWVISGSTRDAYIFNATYDLLQNQSTGWYGRYQSYNSPTAGPSFGGGMDINVLNSLERGTTYSFSYGNGSTPITVGGKDANPVVDWFEVQQLEVFTFSPAMIRAQQQRVVFVPDQANTISLMLVSLLGLAFLRLNRRK